MSFGPLATFTVHSGASTVGPSQMSATVTNTTPPRACCENGRPIMTDPHTGQTICSCQYGTALLNYSRMQGLPEGAMYGATAAYAGAAQGYVPLGTEGSAFYSPLANPAAFDMKEGSEAWRTLTQPGGCFPYDPSMAIYPYGTGYAGLDLNARRKNATRETTNTLKAWLYEHRKNPYPTKGEKIMLAIITKMTLTQVSTWFANARRRLKKENKMTWSPRNRSEDGGDNDDDDDIDLDDNNKENASGIDSNSVNDSRLNDSADESDLKLGENERRDRVERIISVDDDDDSNQSLGDVNDLDPGTDDNNPSEDKRLDSSSPGSSVGEGQSSPNIPRSSKPPDSNYSGGNSEPETDSNTRPKIWSVSDFLGNSAKKDSTGKSTNTPAVVCSRQPHQQPSGSSFINFQAAAAAQSLRNGQFTAGLAGYPLSLSHTTLSYPYTLSSATASKSGLGMHHPALRMSEAAMDKSARIQSGLFSPAREIDGLRVGGKMVL